MLFKVDKLPRVVDCDKFIGFYNTIKNLENKREL